jgi:hypothetical protein
VWRGVALSCALLSAACGGAPSAEVGGTSADDGPAATAATVEVIEVLVERGEQEAFQEAATGDTLEEGDVVRTDPIGFAAIDYIDGSLARLGPSSTLTVVALADQAGPVDTRVDLDAGRLWSRVEDVTESEGRYEVGTPVGVAAVRGTVFDVSCLPDRCTFSVFEGAVDVTLPDGTVIRIEEGRSLEVVAGVDPGDPLDLPADGAPPDPWVGDNRARDSQRDLEAAGGATTVTVAGNDNPWLAGMPDGTQTRGDNVPEHAPTEVGGLELTAGQELMFVATGATSNGGAADPPGTPDGDGPFARGEEFGISGVTAPLNGLIGVFLGDEPPDATPAPATLDFSTPEARDFDVLEPELEQSLFIGNGLREDGTPHRIVVPEGATRLFLGSLDGYGWYNNSGEFTVVVATASVEG